MIRKHWDRYLLSAAIIIVLIALSVGYMDCREIDGKYVRGLFWMECLTGKP